MPIWWYLKETERDIQQYCCSLFHGGQLVPPPGPKQSAKINPRIWRSHFSHDVPYKLKRIDGYQWSGVFYLLTLISIQPKWRWWLVTCCLQNCLPEWLFAKEHVRNVSKLALQLLTELLLPRNHWVYHHDIPGKIKGHIVYYTNVEIHNSTI